MKYHTCSTLPVQVSGSVIQQTTTANTTSSNNNNSNMHSTVLAQNVTSTLRANQQQHQHNNPIRLSTLKVVAKGHSKQQHLVQQNHLNKPHQQRPKVIRASEYRNLRQVVPSLRRQRDVGKVEVVTEAARYIDHLHKTLIERFVLCGIPESLKDVLGTDDANELNSQHIMNLVTQMAIKQRQQQQQQQQLNATRVNQTHLANAINAANSVESYGTQRAQRRNRRVTNCSMQVASRLRRNHRRHHHHQFEARLSVAAAPARRNSTATAIAGVIRPNLNGAIGSGTPAAPLFSTTSPMGCQQETATPVVRANGVTCCARRALPIAKRRLTANNLLLSATEKEEDKSKFDD